jgi:L-fuconolactonase
MDTVDAHSAISVVDAHSAISVVDAHSAISVVDAHAHIWDTERLTYDWLRGLPALNRRIVWEDLAQHLETARVQQVVLVEAHNSRAETEWLLTVAQAQPRVLAVVGAALEPNELRSWLPDQPPKLAGVRLNLAVPQPDWRRVTTTLELLAAADLCCDLLLPPVFPQPLLEVLCDLSGRVVLNHFAGAVQASPDPNQWQRCLEPVAALPQVALKLSGRKHVPTPMLEAACGLFGAARLLYGSNFPLHSGGNPLSPWLETLPYRQQAQILGGNARTIYRGLHD